MKIENSSKRENRTISLACPNTLLEEIDQVRRTMPKIPTRAEAIRKLLSEAIDGRKPAWLRRKRG